MQPIFREFYTSSIVPLIDSPVFADFVDQYAESLGRALQEARSSADSSYWEALTGSLVKSLYVHSGNNWDHQNDPIRHRFLFQLLSFSHLAATPIPLLINKLFSHSKLELDGAVCILGHLNRPEFRALCGPRDRSTAQVFKELFGWYLSLDRGEFETEANVRDAIDSWLKLPGIRQLQGVDPELNHLARQVSQAMESGHLLESTLDTSQPRPSPRKPASDSPRKPVDSPRKPATRTRTSLSLSSRVSTPRRLDTSAGETIDRARSTSPRSGVSSNRRMTGSLNSLFSHLTTNSSPRRDASPRGPGKKWIAETK